jgi:hypothetical protein
LKSFVFSSAGDSNEKVLQRVIQRSHPSAMLACTSFKLDPAFIEPIDPPDSGQRIFHPLGSE